MHLRFRGVLCTLSLVFCFSQSATAEGPPDDAENFERIPPGRTLVLAAEVGTSSDILGLGFNEQFSEFDNAGKSHRVYPAKFKTVDENQYVSRFEQIDNEFLLNAHARFLSTTANINLEKSKRYIVLKVYQLRKVETLEPTGEPLDAAPLLAQKIYYGWALNVVIEGDAATFTSDIAAQLMTAGGSIETTLKKYQLRSYVHLVGLEPKEPGKIPVVVKSEEIAEAFKVAEKPSPIFVEYRVIKEQFGKKVPWAVAGMHAGRYKLAKIKLVVANSKDDGRDWDALGGAPDPLITVYIDGEPSGTCLQRDTREPECEFDKLVDLTETSTLELEVLDKDVSENDPIGRAYLGELGKSGREYSDMEMKTTGQVNRAVVSFLPAPN